jgi:hypothetical protein
MRRILTAVTVFGFVTGLLFAGVERAAAAITDTPDVLPVGDTFVGAFGVENLPDFGNFESVQVEKGFASTAPIGSTISWGTGDLPRPDFDGLRLTERITNNTGVAWTDYHLTFDNPIDSMFDAHIALLDIPGTWAVTGSVPNFVAVNAPSVASSVTAGPASVDFVFASPILPGGNFGLLIAFTPLNDTVAGSVHITQTPSVPEPSAIILAALGMAVVLVWRRRFA